MNTIATKPHAPLLMKCFSQRRLTCILITNVNMQIIKSIIYRYVIYVTSVLFNEDLSIDINEPVSVTNNFVFQS